MVSCRRKIQYRKSPVAKRNPHSGVRPDARIVRSAMPDRICHVPGRLTQRAIAADNTDAEHTSETAHTDVAFPLCRSSGVCDRALDAANTSEHLLVNSHCLFTHRANPISADLLALPSRTHRRQLPRIR